MNAMASEHEANWTGNSSHPSVEDFVITNTVVQVVFSIFYGSIFVLGVFGNVLVCYVVIRNRQMQTVTNLFITNLAVSDVLLCMLAVPFTPLYTFLGGWIFGRTLCHLVPYAQGVSVYTSTLTLTSIAIDRFMVIIHPFHPRMKIEVCLAVIFGIWVVALLVTLPYGIYMHLEEPNAFCEEHWPSERFRKIFSSVTSMLQFAVPFFVIAFCYTRVSFKLKDRAKSKPGTKSDKREEADRERKKRTNRMLIAMVTIFGTTVFLENRDRAPGPEKRRRIRQRQAVQRQQHPPGIVAAEPDPEPCTESGGLRADRFRGDRDQRVRRTGRRNSVTPR
ncbi:neuropeptide FF receptor 2 isoform X2 [Augochlora pura]